jgi:hypothetical protein
MQVYFTELGWISVEPSGAPSYTTLMRKMNMTWKLRRWYMYANPVDDVPLPVGKVAS